MDAFNSEQGFDKPIAVQYLDFIWNLLHGDLGRSYKLNEDVTELLHLYLGRSAMLAGVSMALALAIAIPMGIYQATRRHKPVDSALTAVTFLLYACPSFLLVLVAIEIFSMRLGWVPSQASQEGSSFAVFTDPRAMALPVLCLAVVQVAVFVRYQRSAAIDVLQQDYVKVARAKGVPEGGIVRRHVLRNALLPIITLVGISVPALLAGSLIVESVFNYPGMGLLFINSLQREDYPVLLAYTLIGAILTVLGNLFADIALAVVDPRIAL